MKLTYVTLTGADDTINPADLIALSEKYPFVEWAILFSQSKSGVSRYPSVDWVDQLVPTTQSTNRTPAPNFAAHLCGKWVDDAMKGEITFLRDERMNRLFQRVQLNMGKDRLQLAMNCKPLYSAVKQVSQQVIFGGNYKYIKLDADFFLETELMPLFDASGGRGVLTKEWPKPFETKSGVRLMCGYAGGLGPDNVGEELERIAAVVDDPEFPASPIWIDMETKLRTDDKFDLEKCEQVLQAAKPWVG